MIYEYLVHGENLHDISDRHGVKYNTVRNFIKYYRKEIGLKYRDLPFDRTNPIAVPTSREPQEAIEVTAAVDNESKPFPFLSLEVDADSGSEKLSTRSFHQLQETLTLEQKLRQKKHHEKWVSK